MKTKIITTLSFLFLAAANLAHAEIPMGYFESEGGSELFIRTSGERVFAFYFAPNCDTTSAADSCGALYQLEETEDASIALRRVEGSIDHQGILVTNPVVAGSLQTRIRRLRGGRESLELVMNLSGISPRTFARARRPKVWLDTPAVENFFGVSDEHGDLTVMAGGSGIIQSDVCSNCSSLRVQVAADGIFAVSLVSHDMERESGLSLLAGTRGFIIPISSGGLVRSRREYRFVKFSDENSIYRNGQPHRQVLFDSQSFISR